jgi:hypothetical protein
MKNLAQKILKILVVIFLLSNSACDNLKGLVITQLDIKNNVANNFKIKKVDTKKCNIEVDDMPSAPLDMNMHGAFCLSPNEFARYKAKLETECKNKNIPKDQ